VSALQDDEPQFELVDEDEPSEKNENTAKDDDQKSESEEED
jgi:hypothetical protein